MNIIPFRKKTVPAKVPAKIEQLVQFSREVDGCFDRYISQGFDHKDLIIIIANRLGAYFGHYMLANATMHAMIVEQIQIKSIEEAQIRCAAEGIAFNEATKKE